MNKNSIIFTLLVLCAFSTALLFKQTNMPFGSAPIGLPATVASSTLETANTTANTIVASSTGCTARVITTTSQPIMLTFRDADTPTGFFGHLQAASTTVAYDSGLYGCGLMRAFSFNAASTITATVLQ